MIIILKVKVDDGWTLELVDGVPIARATGLPFWGLAQAYLCPHPIFHVAGVLNVLPVWWGVN